MKALAPLHRFCNRKALFRPLSGDRHSVFPQRRINDVADAHALPAMPVGTEIPKVIHQVFIGELPDRIREVTQRLRDQNPEFVYKLYDEAAMNTFVRAHYGEEVFGYFNRISSRYAAARSDFFRYLLIYREGGIYLDVKSTLQVPASELVRDIETHLLCHWDNRPGELHAGYGWHTEVAALEEGELQQWHIVSVAGHPFLKAVIDAVLTNIDYYRPWRDGVGQRGTMRLAGPTAYTLAILKIKDRHAHSYRRTGASAGLDYSALESSTAHRALTQDYRWQRQSIVLFDHPVLRCAAVIYALVIVPVFLLRRLRIRIRAR